MKFSKYMLSIIAFLNRITTGLFDSVHDHGDDHHHDHRDLQILKGEVATRSCGFHEPSEEVKKEIQREIDNYMEQVTRQGNIKMLSETRNINVHFHILKYNNNGDLSDATVQKQIDDLNLAFDGNPNYASCCRNDTPQGPHPPSPFQFNLASITEYNVNEFVFNQGPFSTSYENFMVTNRKGDCSILNVYTGDADGYLGYATLPHECSSNRERDGVALNYKAISGGSSSDYNEGDTLVHEVGHWLGLYHTFQGGCFSGDGVDDTPAQADANYGCILDNQSLPNTCPDLGNDPIYNYMGYADDRCMFRFTTQQIERMTSQFDLYRSPLPGAPTFPPTVPPTIRTTISPTSKYTISPTSSPTHEPTPSPECKPNEAKLNIKIQVDSKATQDRNRVLLYKKNSQNKWQKVFSKRLKDNDDYELSKCYKKRKCYKLRIYDKGGDGICCGHGQGFYNVKFKNFKEQGNFSKGKKQIMFFGNCNSNKQGFGNDDNYFDDDFEFNDDDDYYVYDEVDDDNELENIENESERPISRISEMIQDFILCRLNTFRSS